MDVTIRDATAGDVPAIREVASRAWPATYAELFSAEFIEYVLEHGYDPDRLAEAIADPDGHFLVAEQDGEVTGYLHHARGELIRLYVEPDRIGTGLGRALVRALEERLGPGAEYTALVREGNDLAIGFYLNEGFVTTARIDGRKRFLDGWPGDPEFLPPPGRDLLMRRQIPGPRS